MIRQRVVSTRPQLMSSHQTADPDIVVLREGTEGLSMASYADALRERLPDQTVALARTPAEERELVPKARVVTGSRSTPTSSIAPTDWSCSRAPSPALTMSRPTRCGTTASP